MREETRRKLDQVQREERRGLLKALQIAVAVCVTASAVLLEPERDVGTLEGKLRVARLYASDSGIPPHWDLWVTRADGSDVLATSRLLPPMLGERIVLVERRGRV